MSLAESVMSYSQVGEDNPVIRYSELSQLIVGAGDARDMSAKILQVNADWSGIRAKPRPSLLERESDVLLVGGFSTLLEHLATGEVW